MTLPVIEGKLPTDSCMFGSDFMHAPLADGG